MTILEARAHMKAAMHACREARRDLDVARGAEMWGATAGLIETALTLVRAVRAYLKVTETDGV